MSTLSLVEPTTRLRQAWRQAHAEWGPGLHEDGFGLLPSDDVETDPGFAAWIARLTGEELVSYRSIVEGEQVLGGIALRHAGHEHAEWAGHIGFGIRPSARGRGVATWAVRCMLDEARTLGLHRVLLVCEAGNVASAKTIEKAGGVLERAEHVRRYWLDT
ncbi:GNAT family N-acetyltransferase [Labedaea rhizosphaerae]|uniref:Putative acetyltransferase n=1 Tax=Labedaea rhizosphaerae TaxID=598644 RepID=A0A4R6S376_LABRH|nr:GNAT family N-acetyltransferase [Labedaea rhizosphaerae]TDP93664.1 putative acetyltransferase [Labedaea rhizosphaerae]